MLDDDSSSLFPGWRLSPDTRGTADILWSCFSTVFLCLWTMLHLNVPSATDTFWKIFWRKTRWLIMGILAPEVPMMFACGQWSSAKRSVQHMRQLGFTQEQWSVSHAFLADMGGMILELRDEEPFPVTAKQVGWLVEQGHMGLPDITAKEITDKSKGDTCTKLLAVAQTFWFVIQLITRGATGSAIAPIELASAALALASLTTLRFWRAKPLDVHQPFIIRLNKSTGNLACRLNPQTETETITGASKLDIDISRETKSDLEAHRPQFPLPLPLDDIEPGAYISRKWSMRMLRRICWLNLQQPRLDRVPNDRDPQILGMRQHLTLAIATATFATLHFVDWNFKFPTHTELLMWRVNCVVMWLLLAVYGTAEVVICWREGYQKLGMDTGGGYKKRFPACLCFFIPGSLYFLIRFLVTAQVFISLRALPPGCFQQVQWIAVLPHIG